MLPPAPPPKALVLTTAILIAAAGCRERTATVDSEQGGGPVQTPAADQPALAPEALGRTLALFNRGAALMERYEYAQAAAAFGQVLESAPAWTAARFNLGIAYLNMSGQTEAKRKRRCR